MLRAARDTQRELLVIKHGHSAAKLLRNSIEFWLRFTRGRFDLNGVAFVFFQFREKHFSVLPLFSAQPRDCFGRMTYV